MRASFVLAIALSVPFAMIACGLDDTAIIADQARGAGDGSTNGDGTIGSGDGGTTGGDSGGGDGGAGTDSASDGDSGTDAGRSPETLVYANTDTHIWSFDVTTNILTRIAQIGCSGNHADVAVDATGQAYVLEQSDAVYKISLVDGTCTARNVLDGFTGDQIHLAARAAGTPGFLAVDPQNDQLLALDPSAAVNAHVTTLQNDYFVDAVPGDVVCDGAGGCWTALPHNDCSSGSGNACLYSFPADGSSSPVSRGPIAVIPAGLAYANGSLYAFGDDGRIYEVNTSGTPAATEKTPAQIIGAASEPGSWAGAASSSSY